jgi:excisionase family DNA binding protein
MSIPESDEIYLTVAEVAATLKLNQQTVRNWIDQGSLPALRVGRRVRIKRSDFQRILDESYSGAERGRLLGRRAGRPGGARPLQLT